MKRKKNQNGVKLQKLCKFYQKIIEIYQMFFVIKKTATHMKYFAIRQINMV